MKSYSYNNFENNKSKSKWNSNCICYQCLVGIPGPTGPTGSAGGNTAPTGYWYN